MSDPITNEMLDHFNKRTARHISLYKKYAQKLSNFGLTDIEGHDASKYQEPEFTPYVHLSWKYKNQATTPYNPSQEMADRIHEATLHHITTNKHHPEYWAPEVHLNKENRDQPAKTIVDATKMPLANLAEMAADWMAMSEEKGTNPYDWAKANIGTRWKFSQDQIDSIYKMLDYLTKGA